MEAEKRERLIEEDDGGEKRGRIKRNVKKKK